MDKETYEALKDIVLALKHSNETNDFSYFILNPNPTRSNIIKLQNWIDEVAKEYSE